MLGMHGDEQAVFLWPGVRGGSAAGGPWPLPGRQNPVLILRQQVGVAVPYSRLLPWHLARWFTLHHACQLGTPGGSLASFKSWNPIALAASVVRLVLIKQQGPV